MEIRIRPHILGSPWRIRESMCTMLGNNWHVENGSFVNIRIGQRPQKIPSSARKKTNSKAIAHEDVQGTLQERVDKVLRGFEPRSLDSESRVLTVTP